MRALIITAACLAALCLPATAKPAKPSCKATVSAVTERLQAQIAEDGSFDLTVYTADRAKQLLDAFNEMPPVSHIRAEKLIILSNSESEAALILLATGDCVTGSLPPIRLDAWKAIVKRVLGTES